MNVQGLYIFKLNILSHTTNGKTRRSTSSQWVAMQQSEIYEILALFYFFTFTYNVMPKTGVFKRGKKHWFLFFICSPFQQALSWVADHILQQKHPSRSSIIKYSLLHTHHNKHYLDNACYDVKPLQWCNHCNGLTIVCYTAITGQDSVVGFCSNLLKCRILCRMWFAAN